MEKIRHDSAPASNLSVAKFLGLLRVEGRHGAIKVIADMTEQSRNKLQTELEAIGRDQLFMQHRRILRGECNQVSIDAEGPGGMSPGYELHVLESLLRS